MTTFKVNGFDLSRSVPVNDQLWRRRLWLTMSGGTRFVGVATQDHDTLLGALVYIANMSMQPMPPGPDGKPGFRIGMQVQALVPFELLGPVTVVLENPDYSVRLWDQPDEVSSWFFAEYQNYFDPPLVVPASQLKLLEPK